MPHVLNFQFKKLLNLVILNRGKESLETVQALLATACYSNERSLILSLAIRMALDLALPSAYEELTRRLMMTSDREESTEFEKMQEAILMRQARTWFGLLVLEHMFVHIIMVARYS